MHTPRTPLDFPGSSVVRNPPVSAAAAEDTGSIPGSGRSPGVGNGNPLQDSCLGNSKDRGTWQASLWGHKESDTTWQLPKVIPAADSLRKFGL